MNIFLNCVPTCHEVIVKVLDECHQWIVKAKSSQQSFYDKIPEKIFANQMDYVLSGIKFPMLFGCLMIKNQNYSHFVNQSSCGEIGERIIDAILTSSQNYVF